MVKIKKALKFRVNYLRGIKKLSLLFLEINNYILINILYIPFN